MALMPTQVLNPQIVSQATVWTDDEPFLSLTSDWLPDHSVRWLDVAATSGVDDAFDALEPFCAGQLERRQVACLVSPDFSDRKCRDFSDGEVRLARAFAVEVEPPANNGDRVPILGTLLFWPVHVLAGNGWLVTCRHPAQRFDGAVLVDCDEPELPLAPVMSAVERRWTSEGLGRSAADLGVLILHELALTFAPAHRAVSAWLEEWELRLYRDNQLDDTALPRLWGTMALLRDWISPLNRSGMGDDIDKAWFRDATDHELVIRVDDRIDRALLNLTELGAVLRASFAMRHSRIEERDRDRKEERQRRIEYVAAVFLVPSLVVGFYGANTKLPGKETWTGFREMVAALIVLTALAVAGVWSMNRRVQ
jgi:hypothetical protein